MLGGEPLRVDASIRDFNGGIGCHVASTLEETLILPKDMVELRNMKKNEIFMNMKRHMGMVWYPYCFTRSFYFIVSLTLFSLGCSSHFQARGDDQCLLPAAG